MKALPEINEQALGPRSDPLTEQQLRRASLFVAGRVVQGVPVDMDVREAARGPVGEELLELLQVLGLAAYEVAPAGKPNGSASFLHPRGESAEEAS